MLFRMKYIAVLISGMLLLASCYPSRALKEGETEASTTKKEGSGSAQLDYIAQFKDIAMAEMERSGIPASIKLAQAILESSSGQSELAKNANNHFGVKCANGQGSAGTYKKKDDDKNDKGELQESCFRRYHKVSESYADHSDFLRDPRKYNRYGFLFNIDRTDYKSWARGLQSAGYATNQNYATQLIDLIERYSLFVYDRPADRDPNVIPNPDKAGNEPPPAEQVPMTGRVGKINNVKVVLARDGETVSSIARQFGMAPMEVANYNDRAYAPGDKLKTGTRIFLQSKRSTWRGRTAVHFVRPGQTMFDISQIYALRLDKLRERNRINPGQEPAGDQMVFLRGNRPRSEPLRLRDPREDPEPSDTVEEPDTKPPGSMTPDTDPLFELDPEGKPVDPGSKPGSTKPPATTGTPLPDDTSTTDTGNYPDFPNNGKPPVKPTVPGALYHTVVKGDTMYNLSVRYRTTVPRLQQLNNMKDVNIKIGQSIRVQ